jgi:adenosylcobinamide kinase/adenosylcobinamide-phosphate guanylyltransferase
MKVTLLGTGSADGWPNPWCGCASCEWARTGPVRSQTAVLVNDDLLIDIGPDVPRSAARFGIPLHGLRHVLVSHAHPDHVGPEALMWRSWSTVADRPLDVVGPPAALDVCRAFLSRWEGRPQDRTGSPLRFVPAHPGSVLTLGAGAQQAGEPGPAAQRTGYTVRPVAARHGDASIGPAVLYDVTAPDSGRLLYACDTAAPLPAATLEALRGRAFDVVLAEENNGDRPGFGEHLDLASFAAVLAELRRSGAVVGSTRVVAVHLSHRNPPGDELARRLDLMGAELLPDGTVLDIVPGAGAGGRSPRVTTTSAAEPAPTVTTTVTVPTAGSAGRPGARTTTTSTTTSTAASTMTATAVVTATGTKGPAGAAGVTGPAGAAGAATGAPWAAPAPPRRVLITGGSRSGKSAEAERRLLAEPEVVYVATAEPAGPDDTEWADRIAIHRRRRPAGWTTVETTHLVPLLRADGPPLLVDSLGLWVAAHLDDLTRLAALTEELVAAWRSTRRRVVAVTDEVGSGVVPPSKSGRRFRDALGRLNADLAAESDEVWHVVAGIPTRLRPAGVNG